MLCDPECIDSKGLMGETQAPRDAFLVGLHTLKEALTRDKL